MLPITKEIAERAKGIFENAERYGDDDKFFLRCEVDRGAICNKTKVPLTIQTCTDYVVGQIEGDFDRFKELWEDTKNPCFVFEAYRLSREYSLDIPEWVLEYFDLCYKNMHELLVSSLHVNGKGVDRDAVRDIFCFNSKGQGSYISRWAKSRVKRIFIGGMLRVLAEGIKTDVKLKGLSKEDFAIEEVISQMKEGLFFSKGDISFETARAWWHTFKKTEKF
jgi:hypothetical protein